MKTIGRLLLFIGVWSTASLVAVAVPIPASIDESGGNLFFSMFLALHLLIAASLGYGLITAIFDEKKSVIVALCGTMLLLFIFSIGFGGMVGNTSFFFRVLHSALLLSGATIAGALLSSAIKRLGELIPVCCTAAIADLVSVAEGPTSSMIADISTYYQCGMRGETPLVDYFLVKAGMPGYHAILPIFGVTDWVLVSLLTASLLRLGKTDNLLSGGRKAPGFLFVPVSAVGLLVSLILARFTNMFVPAMAVISGLFLLFVAFRFDIRKEIHRSDLAYSLFLPCCVALLVLVFSA